ncbi:MAG: DbpA RNA binding domain-containing protein [Methylococcales bacterium]|nr:DbpA RNA binding domain-containing protein [Methylococcales bacterium]
MSVDSEHTFSQHIQDVLATTNTDLLQKHLGKIAENLHIQPLALAAALLHLDAATIASCHAMLRPDALIPTGVAGKKQPAEQLTLAPKNAEVVDKQKMVRYRIEIGRDHHVSADEIKAVLIDESGVDRNSIGYLDIRSNYTLIDLPPGMPPDIFQLLQEVEIKQQPLQIKRVNSSRKRPWQRRKGSSQNRATERDPHQTKGAKINA